MKNKLDTLYELCDLVYHDIEAANEKIKMSGGELSQGDVDYLQKLSSTMKNIKMTIGMIEAEEEGYSGYYYYDGNMAMEGRGGRGGNRGGNSYRGRNSYANRPLILPALKRFQAALYPMLCVFAYCDSFMIQVI